MASRYAVFLAVLLLCGVAFPAAGADHRAAKDEELLRALEKAGPGDTVRLNRSLAPAKDIFLSRQDIVLTSVQELRDFLDRLGTSIPLYRFGQAGEKGRPVTLAGYKGGQPRINAGSGIPQRGPVLGIDKDHVEVAGLVLEQARMGAFLRDCDAALAVTACSDVLIRKVMLRGNQGGGARLYGAADVRFEDTEFRDNETRRKGGGLFVGPGVAGVTLRHARFYGNKAYDGGGGIAAESSLTLAGNSVFSGNSVAGGASGGAIWLGSSGQAPIRLFLEPGARENVAFQTPNDTIAGEGTGDMRPAVVARGEGTWTMRAACTVPAVVEKGRLFAGREAAFAAMTLKPGASLIVEAPRRSADAPVPFGNLDVSGGGVQLTVRNASPGKAVPFARYETFKPGEGAGLGFILCKGGRVADDPQAKELSVFCP